MRLLPGDIVLIHRGTGWMIFAPLVWFWQWAVGPYHVEMVWDLIPNGYKAFSLQPPVLLIAERWFSYVKITVFRLRERPENMDEMLWKWGNEKILHTPYILGWSTCGHPVRDFYKLDCSPYPGAIEKFCKKSDKFVEVR
jgi:hypothetical protein